MAKIEGLKLRVLRLKKVLLIFAASVSIVLAVMVMGKVRQHGDGQHAITIASCNSDNLRMDSSIVADSEIEALLRPYRDSVSIEMSRQLCESDEEMVARRPESNLMRFLSDLFLCEVRAYASDAGVPVPDFALLNVGGMRSALPKGELCLADVFRLAPFENSAVALGLDSAAVYELMQHIAERGGEAISGASFTLSPDGVALSIRIGGKPLDGNKTYMLATLDYLATGGDDFECLVGKTISYQSGISLRDLIAGYLERKGRQGQSIKAPDDTRISIRNEKSR